MADPTWKQGLLDAKLDDVVFLYREVRNTSGRRTDVTEFSGRDEPYVEDHGKMFFRTACQAFLIGDNYVPQRDRLIDILTSGGTKRFQHPYLGDIPVQVHGEVTWIESDTNGGVVTFDFTLVQVGEAEPLIRITFEDQAPARVAAVAEVSAAEPWDLSDATGALLGSVVSEIQRGVSMLAAVNGEIEATLGEISQVSQALQHLSREVAKLVSTPQRLKANLFAIFLALGDILANAVPNPRLSSPSVAASSAGVRIVADLTAQSFTELFSFTSTARNYVTPIPQAQQEDRVHGSITSTFRQGAIFTAISAYAGVQLESSNDATLVIQTLDTRMSDTMASLTDPKVYSLFERLKADTIEHLVKVSQNAPRVKTTLTRATESSVMLAYRLFGDARRAEDIVLRNKIPHPLFIPAYISIESLHD